jgi:hypothetical protein
MPKRIHGNIDKLVASQRELPGVLKVGRSDIYGGATAGASTKARKSEAPFAIFGAGQSAAFTPPSS